MNAIQPIDAETAEPIEAAQDLPANVAAEQAVLGAILVNGAAWRLVSPFLRPEHFFEPVHQRIYQIAGEMILAGRTVTPVSIKAFLPADLPIGDISLGQYLAHLAAESIGVAFIEGAARGVFDDAIRRELIAFGTDVKAEAFHNGSVVPARKLVEAAEARLLDLAAVCLTADRDQRAPVSYGTVIANATDRMHSGDRLRGFPTGLTDIDERTGGFAGGDYVIIGGRPSMGKTGLALSIARRAANLRVGIAFDSIEMPVEWVKQRLITDECEAGGVRIAYRNLARGKITDAELAAATRASERLEHSPLEILDLGDRLADIPNHIRAARKALAAKGSDLNWYFVDYLGLLRPGDRYAGQRVNEVSEISAFLKNLAKRENLAIFALHQLSRASEGRGHDYRPRPSDLRDSGALEQDADFVIFVHRESYYIERPGFRQFGSEQDKMDALERCKNEMEVIIAKQRQGPTGTVTVYFDEATNAVRDRARGG